MIRARLYEFRGRVGITGSMPRGSTNRGDIFMAYYYGRIPYFRLIRTLGEMFGKRYKNDAFGVWPLLYYFLRSPSFETSLNLCSPVYAFQEAERGQRVHADQAPAR